MTNVIVRSSPHPYTETAFPLVALDLRLKLLIWEEPGKVQVAYTPPAELAERYGVTGKDQLFAGDDAPTGGAARGDRMTPKPGRPLIDP
jgi:hypothetical protein